jgi:hypothetical protein
VGGTSLMARVAQRIVDPSGAYAFVAAEEEKEYSRWEIGERQRLKNGYQPRTYPRWRRLEAVRAGRPVTVFDYDLPKVARADHLPGRVTVSPTDVITGSDENPWRAWLEENDL